jgi:hypothetical protein
LTVGVVYVGARDDFGWNQAHAVAIKSLAEVPGVKVVEEENVPEPTRSRIDGIDDQSRRRWPHPGDLFGYYSPFVIDLAKISDVSSVTPRRYGTRTRIRKRRLLFRLSQPGALRKRRRSRSFDEVQQDRLRGCEDSDRAEQHQFGLARGARAIRTRPYR